MNCPGYCQLRAHLEELIEALQKENSKEYLKEYSKEYLKEYSKEYLKGYSKILVEMEA